MFRIDLFNIIFNFAVLDYQIAKSSQIKQIKEFKNKIRKLMQKNLVIIEELNCPQNLEQPNDVIFKIERLKICKCKI